MVDLWHLLAGMESVPLEEQHGSAAKHASGRDRVLSIPGINMSYLNRREGIGNINNITSISPGTEICVISANGDAVYVQYSVYT